MTEETFEQFFPPAGWTNKGLGMEWIRTRGDHTAFCGIDDRTFISHHTKTGSFAAEKLIFECYNQFTSNDRGTYQNNDVV